MGIVDAHDDLMVVDSIAIGSITVGSVKVVIRAAMQQCPVGITLGTPPVKNDVTQIVDTRDLRLRCPRDMQCLVVLAVIKR